MDTLASLRVQLKKNPDRSLAGILNYVEDFASMMGYRIYDWPLDVILFADGKLQTSKTEVNRLLIDYSKTVTMRAADAEVKLSDQEIQAIQQWERNHFEAERKRAEKRVDVIMENLVELRRKEAQLCKDMRSLQEFSSQSFNLVTVVNEICALGFFSFKMTSGGELHFQTEQVTLEYKRKDGEEFRVPFGSFMVRLEPVGMSFTVRPNYTLDTNVFMRRHSHPHVNPSGGVCWGDASALVEQYRRNKQYVELFRLLASLLQSYNPANPYVSLETFFLQGLRNDGTAPWRPSVEPVPELPQEVFREIPTTQWNENPPIPTRLGDGITFTTSDPSLRTDVRGWNIDRMVATAYVMRPLTSASAVIGGISDELEDTEEEIVGDGEDFEGEETTTQDPSEEDPLF